MSREAYMSLCGYCAERIGKTRDIEEASMEFMGHCSNCGQYGQLVQFEVGMSHAELDRRRRARAAAANKGAGGGERRRAERRQ